MTIYFNNAELEIRKKLAYSEDTSFDILEKLSKDSNPEVRQAVASNPNTPTETLLALGQEFPNEFLNNPIFSLLLLENPSFVTEIPLATLRSLVKQDNVPESFIINFLTREVDVTTLLSIIAKLKTSTNVLEQLIQSKFTEVAEAAKLHINWSGEISEGYHELAQDSIKAIHLLYSGASINIKYLQHEQPYLAILAKVGYIPEFLILHWQKHWNKDAVFCFIAGSINTPPNVLAELGKNKNPRIRRIVAENPSTPIKTLEHLVEDEAQGSAGVGDICTVKVGVYKNPSSSANVLDKLADHPNYLVRKAIAEHSNCSIKTLEILAKDENIQVRYKVATNLNTPCFILKKIIDFEPRIPIKEGALRLLKIKKEYLKDNYFSSIKRVFIYILTGRQKYLGCR